jgi:hypothetical protein
MSALILFLTRQIQCSWKAPRDEAVEAYRESLATKQMHGAGA